MLTASRNSSHFMQSGKYTRFWDWRFIHQARLNLLPLSAARKGAVRMNRRCWVCREEDKMLPHIVNHCLRHFCAWIHRNNEILVLLRAVLPPKWKMEMNKRVAGDPTLLRLDLVIMEVPEEAFTWWM